MYTHLLNSSNLYVGRTFDQGSEMGQMKTGTFNENCGYASQSSNWFHVHWGFPNTGSFQAEGWTLTFATQLWQQGSETRGIHAWFTAEGASSSTCNPSSNEIALFVDANYSGQCVVKGIGNYPNPGSIGLPNDSISSIRVGSGVRAVLCRDDNYGGVCETFTGDDPNLSNNSIGDNQVSSARVESTSGGSCVPGTNQIALFVDPNYGGQCVVKGHGDYRNPAALGLPNDSISSIRVGSNTVAVLCRDDNYAGTCEIFANDDSNLSDNSIGNDSVSSAWADVNASSFKVLLYENADFQGNGCGLQAAGGAGSVCSGFNDTASSIRIMPGWSARVWKHSDFGGPSHCFTSSDPNFSNNTFEDGSSMDNEISSFAAYNQSNCPPLLPNAPTNLTISGATQNSITLSWQDNSSNETGFRIYRWNGTTFAYLASVGANVTAYTDTGLLCANDYFYEVSAYNANGESPHTPWTMGTTSACPLPGPLAYSSHLIDDDTSGNSNGNGNGIVNPGETIELYVTLGNQGSTTANGVNATLTTTDPYAAILYNTVSSYPNISGGSTGQNQDDWDIAISASTPDGHVITFCLNPITATNGGPWQSCFNVTVFATPQPDLYPYAPLGYSFPVVPSSIPGTNITNTLVAGQTTYFDWHFINGGNAVAPGTFYTELWVGGTRYIRYPQPDFHPGWVGGFDDWAETISTPGWHTVQLIIDADNTVSESDETNNIWSQQFYWADSAPYFEDMENGTNDWIAAGLWHQVDGYTSPYPQWRSWSHSWWYGQDATGNYDTGAANFGTLTTPPIYIPTTDTYYLRFWYWYETETYSSLWDQRWVQISIDGGAFTNVVQLHSDPMNEWQQSQAIDLSPYAGHTVQIRFYFDTLDGISNNYRGWYVDDVSINTTPPPACNDANEPNNIYTQATSIAYGQSRDGDICPNGDYDFYTFTGVAGDKIVLDIDAQVNGSLLDSYIFLLDSNGSTVLAQNDDAAGSLDSKLGYTLPHDGNYYIKVRAYNHPNTGSPGHFYTLNLYTDDTLPTAQITAPLNSAWINPDLTTITAVANDNESGIHRVEFLWHDADWDNSDWIWLGADSYGNDGWSRDFDTSSLLEQRGGAFYIWAFDWVGNWVGAGVWNLGIDRTPPVVNTDVYPLYGDAPFRDFWVTWWNSSDNLSGIVTYDVQYRDGASGTWTDMVTYTSNQSYRFVGEDNHTYYFRSRARDNAGNVSLYASGDGDIQHTVQICPVSPDSYEPDNVYISANWITTDGSIQLRNVHVEGDEDWVKFSAIAGVDYALTTTNPGGHADTQLSLYDTDGSTLLVFNDDDPTNWPSSRIDWQAPTSGVYYIMVNHWDPWAFGCTTEYGISVTITGELPTSTPTATNTATNTPTNTATATLTNTPTNTPTQTPSATNTATSTSTSTPTYTATATPTNTPTGTSTNVPTNTPTSTNTPVNTGTPTNTPVGTPTSTPTSTPTGIATNTPTVTPTSTPIHDLNEYVYLPIIIKPVPDLAQQVSVTTVNLPSPLEDNAPSWCTWGGCTISPRLYHTPLSNDDTLIGWTDHLGNGYITHVTTSNTHHWMFPAKEIRGLVAHTDNSFAAILWDRSADTIWLSKRNFDASEIWTTNLNSSIAKPEFWLGDGRLEYGNGLYAAYFTVQGISGGFTGHHGDQLIYVNDDGIIQTGGWDWGCSHSMAQLISYHPNLNEFAAVCSSDCFPDKSIHWVNASQQIYQADGNCGGLVSSQLGQMAISDQAWKLVFNAQEQPCCDGNGIALATLDSNHQSSYTWLTQTNGQYERDPVIARLGNATTSGRYLVGWTTTNNGVYWLSIINETGDFVVEPENISATGVSWGNRDDSFRTRVDGSISWVQASANSNQIRLFRFDGSPFSP